MIFPPGAARILSAYSVHASSGTEFDLFRDGGFCVVACFTPLLPVSSTENDYTFVTIMFLMLAGGIAFVMAQADRDATLSHITNTTPGALSPGFFRRMVTYLGLPLVTVMASQVPSWGRFLFSWVQPVLEALK